MSLEIKEYVGHKPVNVVEEKQPIKKPVKAAAKPKKK